LISELSKLNINDQNNVEADAVRIHRERYHNRRQWV
jgi:hypothetical protein